MPIAYITVGVSASGKTTWAEQQMLPVVCRDNVREAIAAAEMGLAVNQNLWAIWPFGKVEKRVTALCNDQIQACIDKRQDFIVADTNLNPSTLTNLKSWLEGEGYDVVVKDFDITFDEAVKRDKKRVNSVGFHVLYSQWQKWVEYKQAKGEMRKYVPDPTLPPTIVFDIDGTLAHMNGRSPFDWSKVGEDKVDETVKSMLYGFSNQGHSIVFMSGRDSVCRKDTVKWLQQNGMGMFQTLHMRAEGDMRKDSIIKEELFFEKVAPFHNVKAVVDDRPQVCRMYYDIGIPKVIHVGNPWIEF